MADIQKILDEIKELKLLEVAELVKLMEEEFGVSAAAPVVVAGGAAEGGAAAAEQSEFEVILAEAGASKLNVIKVVRKDNCWRISIRSRTTPINEVAAKWEGGGHAQASGAKIKNLEQLPLFIEDLDKLFR